jgi:hypothetical protein
MKEIKKEVIRKEYQTVYVATDGSEFYDRNECEKYEKSAMGVVSSRYKEFVIKSTTEEDLTKCGSGDYIIEVVKLTEYDDIDVVTQLYCLFYSYNDDNEHITRVRELCKKAVKTGDPLLICRGYDYDNFWVMDTLTDYLNYILKQCDPGSKIRIEDEDDTTE